MKKKIKAIVTGGCGFIGSHLVEKLIKKNFNVIVIDNLETGNIKNINKYKKKLKFIKADIKNYSKIEPLFFKAKYVFHLAAIAEIVPSIDNPQNYFDTNVSGTLNVLKACSKHKVSKIIYSASSSCYGLTKKYPTNENVSIDPQYPYAFTKYQGEQLIIHWSKVYKLDFISLRLFNVYGTRSRTSGAYGAVFGVFLAQKLNKYPFTIVGDGKQKRDFTYVTDVVEAFIKAAMSNKINKIYNVGTGKPTSINKISRLIDKRNKLIYLPKRPGEPDKTHANIKLINKDLNWKPKISIEEGVKKILLEIEYWKKSPLWTASKIKMATHSWFKYLSND
tara:strand:+ start:4670 stop:5671 length:1002 start_codon:yes stop_codon:yes gene_type:complete